MQHRWDRLALPSRAVTCVSWWWAALTWIWSLRVPVIPVPDETVQGHSFSTIPGGKGANRVIAAAHCGAQVTLIGRVGDDDFGERLLMGLRAHGVKTVAIMVSEGVSTGTAIIVVDDHGENTICVAPGANRLLSQEDIDEKIDVLAAAHLILLQLEIPPVTALYAIQQARRYQIPVILNPSPVPAHLDPELLDVDILVPNEHKIAQITDEKGGEVYDLDSARMAGLNLIHQGVKAVEVTLGPRRARGAGQLSVVPHSVIQVPDCGYHWGG